MNPLQGEGRGGLPAKIGNYRIEERLGSGGMGEVYRAFDEALQRPLAIKHLLPNLVNPVASQRFRREAQAAARLNHPAIVHIYDIVETGEGDWIVMELVEGQGLDRMIRDRSLELPLAIRLGREIADGLAEAHAHGIIHRDLKTTNVMVTRAGRAKILDFGLAKFVHGETASDLSQSGIVLGTCHAMSPEQAQGLPLDHRSDLFSLGSLLYEMLTGVSPFRAATVPETLARICSFQPPPADRIQPQVPRELSLLLENLLKKNPAQRPQSADEIARSLAGCEHAGGSTTGSSQAHAGESTVFDGVAVKRARLDPPPSPVSRETPEPSRPTSERRQVTVVCCELVRADEAASPLPRVFDPETLYELMLQLRSLASDVVGRYAGHLGSAFGNRLLIFFGYPQAHEDNAQRAIRAALELIPRISRMETGSDRGGPLRLTLRVGIHTGPAVVATHPQHSEPLTLGATLDLAVELLAAAEPGSVVASPATSSLVQKSFVLEAGTPIRLAGFADAVIPYRVLEPVEVSEGSGLVLTPLVGREREMDLLLDRWSLAREGRGQAVLISGEAGIGKSRLVHDLRKRLGDTSARWMSCYGSPFAQNSPLQPLGGLLRQAIGLEQEGSPLARLEAFLRDLSLLEALPFVAALADLPPEERQAAPELPPERHRERTLEALTALVLEMAERQPLVLSVEDLHWLDPTTLDWLDRLIGQVASAPLFLVLTVRLHAMEALWGPRAHLTQLTLSPLSEAEAKRLIDQVTGEKSLPAAVRRQIVAKTDGVPLFLEELTKAVLESGESGERRELPATLRDSLAARLDRLGTAKEIAQLASVIGRELSFELLAAVSPYDETVLQSELRRLAQAELIHRKGFGRETRYVFKHALVRDAAYDSLLKRERQQLHRRIAETLEARFPETAEAQPELLAHHYTEAGLPEPAIDSWHRAGGLAGSRSANLEAISHFNRALELLASLPPGLARDRREIEIQSSLAAATITSRGYQDPGVERAYSRTELLAERLHETEERFWAVQGLHVHFLVLGDFSQALRLAERLLHIAETSGKPNLRSIACLCLGMYHYYQADFATSLCELETACELASPDDASYRIRTGVDLRVLAMSFASLVLWHLGYPERARSRGEEAIRLARELAQPFTLAFAHGLGGAVLAQYLRDAETAHREARTVYDLAVELGFGLWIWQARLLLAWAGLSRPADGAPAIELEDSESTQRMIEQLGAVAMDYYFCLHTEVLTLQGCPGDALRALDKGLPLVEAKGTPAWVSELYRRKGELLWRVREAAGDGNGAAEAERLFKIALERARQSGSRPLILRAALSLGHLWKSQQRELEARDLITGIYREFTEGFETHDLEEARAFLDSCAMQETT